MPLLESLITTLEHQLTDSSQIVSDGNLKIIVSMINQLQLNACRKDLLNKLQSSLSSYLKACVLRPQLDDASCAAAVAVCLPICADQTVLTLIEDVNGSEREIAHLLDLLLVIVNHVDKKNTPTFQDLRFPQLILPHLKYILEQDDIELVKKASRLLKLMWETLDDHQLQDIDEVIKVTYTPYPHATYMMLCCLVDSMVLSGRFIKNIWDVLITGVQEKESLVRKQSIHMMKTILDAYDKGLVIYCSCPLMRLEEANKPATLGLWSDYILLLESLNEKQYHIVKPNLARIDNVLEAVRQGRMHVRWLLSLLLRVINHDNTQVKKFGVLYIYSLDYKIYPQFLTTDFLPIMYQDFVVMANQSSFFTRRSDEKEDVTPEVFTAMKSYLSTIVAVLSGSPFLEAFLHGVITTLASAPWLPIPCMYWMAALASLSGPTLNGSWNKETLAIVADIVTTNFVLCDWRIRRATSYYLIITVIQLSQITEETMDAICSLIGQLRLIDDGVLKFGSKQWLAVKSAFNLALNNKSITRASALRSVCREELSLMFLLPIDSSIPSGDDLNLHDWLMSACVPILTTCSERSYVDLESVVEALECVVRLCNLISDHGRWIVGKSTDKDDGGLSSTDSDKGVAYAFSTLRSVIAAISDSICQYITSLVSQKVEISTQHVATFTSFIRISGSAVWCELGICWSTLAGVLCNKLGNQSLESEFEWELSRSIFVALSSFSECVKRNKIFQSFLSSIEEHSTGCSSSQGPNMHIRWMFYRDYLLNERLMDKVATTDWQYWYDEAFQALSVLYRQDSCAVLESFAAILSHMDVEKIWEASRCMLTKIEEESKNSHYLPLIKSLVMAVFSLGIAKREECSDLLSEVFESLYSRAEERPGIANILSRQLCTLVHSSIQPPDNQSLSSSWLVSALVKLAIYGPIHNKAHRTVEDAFLFLEETGDFPVTGSLSCHRRKVSGSSSQEVRVGWDIADHQVRVLVIDALIAVAVESDNSASLRFIHDVVIRCTESYKELLFVKCYNNFPNSLGHRQRHRLLCLLLALMSFCSKHTELRETVADFLTTSLKAELQPSCRHQLEWMYIYIMREHPELIERSLLKLMDYRQLVQEKASYVCSLFCIAAHICSGNGNTAVMDSTVSNAQLETMLRVVPLVTPWGMSSKFHMRIHAQAALLKIWQHAAEQNLLETLGSRYPLLKANMDFALHSGTATEKNSRKLLENFFYFQFDAVKDWSIETIFTLWPRLLSLADNESIPVRVFSSLTRNTLSETCHNVQLRTCDPSTWNVKVKEGDNETETIISNVQRKITIWRTVNPSPDPGLEDRLRFKSGLNNDKEQLIVVTSLIDKLPNLGGLCRTAEIFGASEMVVNSLKIREDPNFISTSVTAHQWIPMKQVPTQCLPEYLLEMKQYGYTTIGAEQATNSRCLTEYKMPAKTVLLLGNEKQGIPAELIQLLDVCVEIPQQGVIRSLNVHVSGALLMWEYRKQRLLSNAKLDAE